MDLDRDRAARDARRRVVLLDLGAALAGAAAAWSAAIACYAILRIGLATERKEPAWIATGLLLATALGLAWLAAAFALVVARRRPGPIGSVVAGGALTIVGFVALLGPSALQSPLLLVSAAAPGLIAGAVYALLARP